MPILSWDERFSVEIDLIDEQHRILFQTINDLVDAMQSFKERMVLSQLLDRLKEYTVFHFKAEEEMMERCSFAGLAEHRREHEKFIQMIDDFRKKYEEGDVTISLGVLDFLVDWLKSHIMGTDKKYVSCMKGKV